MNSRIFNQAFFAGLADSTLPIEHAVTLPPECYTDRDFYEFEKAALFDREWLCVGRVNWIEKPGDFFTTTIVGEPIVVARDLKGEIHAMSSVCQHRAMLVAEGSGNARAFVADLPKNSYGKVLKRELRAIEAAT